jgi:hypothetical protein
MMLKPEGFELYEWLPKDFYKKYYPVHGEKLWMMFDRRIKYSMDRIRKRYKCSFVMNDWKWGGKNQYRGWRPMDCETGAFSSQHKFGRGGDSKPVSKIITAEKIRQDILADPWHDDFKFITRIEMKTLWLHIDCGDHNKLLYGILKVYPK